jgi:hypothetical protein
LLRDRELVAEAVEEATRFRDGWSPESAGYAWAARDKFEAVKEFISKLAAEHHAVKVAQKRAALQKARHAEKGARLALLRADPADAADAFVQWKDSLYALQEAGGLATAHRPGGVGPVDLL